jgi:hypothetical protein
MKSLFSLVLLCIFSYAYGQLDEPKFGKIEQSDLSMMKFDKDTTADALMLFDYGTTKFILSPQEDFQFEFKRHFRIKILKKSAFRFADFKFSLYSSGTSREKITELKAMTYNLENGKVVKTKLDDDNIFEEKSGNYFNEKFAFPQVKEGSIIELSYTIVSDFLYNLRGWSFQYSIPALVSQYVCEIPEYYNYRQFAKGYLPFDVSSNETFNQKYTVLRRGEFTPGAGVQQRSESQNVTFNVNTNRFVFTIKNVPAFKSEPNIDCEDNYIQAIEFELSSIKYPNEPIKQYSESWESVNDKMIDDEDFGKLLKSDNFINDTVVAVCKNVTAPLDKAAAIYSWVQKNMKWDGSYRLWATKGLKKPYAEHSGSSAEINLLLTVMLQSAGLKADPVMFSTRENGIALSVFPTITKFNSVLTRLTVDGKPYLMDATGEYCPFGYLPANDINGQGRVVNRTGGDWVNLDTKTMYSEVKNYVMNIDAEGNLKGYLKESYDGYAAINYRESLADEKSEDEYFRKLQEDLKGLTINGYKITDRNNIYKPIADSLAIDITDRIQTAGDKILLQPLLIETLDRNRYTLEDRKYPVNYNYPITESYLFEYTIPEGYQVESIPKAAAIKLPDNSISVFYDVKNTGNKILVTYKRTVSKILFLPEEYKTLKDLYDQVVKKHSENIILKKSV